MIVTYDSGVVMTRNLYSLKSWVVIYDLQSVLRFVIEGSGCQLVERSPMTPEIRGSIPVIGKLLSNICLLSTVLKRQQ